MAGRGSRQMDDEGIYAQLLEQASDLNDELCRENCELRREVSDLRQRQLQRMRRDAEGSRSAKVRKIMPQAMSNIRSALRDLDLEDAPSIEGLPSLLEEAANRVFASMAELQESNAAMASGEETAALIAEKVALKEFCIHQQQRLSELELAKEKLTATSSNWALRLTSALQGMSEPAALPSPAKNSGSAQQEVPPLIVKVGDECEVVGKKGAILRETEDLQSALVATVPPYGHVRIVQVAATQARRALVEVIDSPEVEPAPAGGCAVPGAMGWLSVSTKDGKPLLRPENKSEALPAPEVSEEAPRTDVEMEKPPEVEKIENEGEPGEPSQELESEQVEENVGEVLNTEMDLQLVPSLPSELPEPADGAQPPQDTQGAAGSVTVSTEAWVALRQERAQRERQIKAMQAQVDSARMQLEQLDEVKAKLREYRSAALEARQRGQEFLEGLHMATEELRVLPRPEATSEPVPTEEEPGAEVIPETEEPIALPEDSGVDEETVEWRRLLSERETTARELASTLRQVEEMEKEVEDKRIELDIAQRRRERERSSLLMALRELGSWREGSPSQKDDEAVLDEETSDGPSSRTAWASESSPSTGGHPSGQKGRDEDKERQYLQRISELEESVLKLQEQIDTVQARIALLNQQAVTRQQALRYASSLPSVGGLAESITARVTSRPDLDGLTEMLGRLFVENFDLRRKLRAGSQGQDETSQPSVPQADVDLSRFAVPEGADSDDESLVPHPGSIPPFIPAAESTTLLRLPSPEPEPSRLEPSRTSSPRSLLLALDFKALSVAE